ncbi:MAG: hypothetical protein ACPGVB_08300 [Chitinophagales bacterium]
MKQSYPIILFFLAVLCSLTTLDLQAQNYALDRIYKQGYPRINDYQSQNVVFYFYEYESEDLDLRHFRLSNPVLRLLLPKKVKVKLPPLKWAKDTTYAVGYVTNGDAKEGSLVLMIVANSATNLPTFYLDSNLDHDFSDEKPVVFPNGNKKYRSVSIKDKFDKEKRYDFLLLNPLHQENIPVESKEAPKEEVEEIVEQVPEVTQNKTVLDIKAFNKKAFYINLKGFIGTGKLRYQFEAPLDTFPIVQYEMNYIPKGFGLELGYIYKNFQINVVANYENMYYYTSTLDTSYQHFIDHKGDLQTPRKTLTNIDRLSKNKYSYGLDIGYNLNAGKRFAIAPFLQYTRYNFEKNEYNSDTRKIGKVYNLEERYTIGGGVTLKMMLTSKSLLTYRVVYQKVNFNPEGFFPDESTVSNYELELEQMLIGIGYTLKLF